MVKLQLKHPTKVPQINQGFGDKTDPLMLPKYVAIGLKGHNGLDYQAIEGVPILASHDGTVVYAGLDGSNGNLIVIKTDTTFDYLEGQSYFKTFYGHLQTGSFKVTAGTKVKVGQQIASSGNTGMSFGAHLHFGFKPVRQGEDEWTWFNLEQNNGYNGAIDPTPYLPPVAEFQTPIKYNDSGYNVEKLQAFLIRHKYLTMPTGVALGYYGLLTSDAVYRFQSDNGLLNFIDKRTLKGKGSKVGNKTINKLNELY